MNLVLAAVRDAVVAMRGPIGVSAAPAKLAATPTQLGGWQAHAGLGEQYRQLRYASL
jgi:hypothetical protein